MVAEKLDEYRRKRDFKRTPEPAGGEAPAGRRFVVQRHDARRLHFDLRLEMGGVLKSWALPKGLPAEAKEKHLAVRTEDHPLDYIDFEGTIPEGQYGAGTVEIWDWGTYDVPSGAEPEAALASGKLSFILRGRRVRGEFTLVKTSMAEDSWLVIGHKPPGGSSGRVDSEKLVELDHRELRLTNLTKVFWPDAGFVKADLLRYYDRVAHWLLPHLKDRPMVQKRYPDGIDGPHFFQKDAAAETPAWVRAVDIEETPKTNRYIICDDRPTLLYLANLACIDLNPWSSRVQSLDNPDWLIMDLDPFEAPYGAVVESAHACRDILDRIGLRGYPKTSGATGLHVYVPVAPVYTYRQVRSLGRIIAALMLDRLPQWATLEFDISRRSGKVYLDVLQNVRGKTVAAVYSVRPEPGAPVSTPVEWDELTPDFDPKRFTIATVPERLEEKGDLFEAALSNKQRIEAAVDRLQGLYSPKRAG